MQQTNTTIQNTPSQVEQVSPAFSVFPAYPAISAWKNHLLVLPQVTAPLFYSRRLNSHDLKNVRNKLFTAVLVARREVSADPDSDSRRAL